jgi:proline iminopeptidase
VGSCLAFDNPAENEQEIAADPNTLALALLQTHYFLNDSFVPENYILDNIGKIKHIPSTAVHGRFDMCTPPITARDLAKAYGKNLTLQWVNSGHLRSDPEMLAALRAIANANLV